MIQMEISFFGKPRAPCRGQGLAIFEVFATEQTTSFRDAGMGAGYIWSVCYRVSHELQRCG